MEKIRIFVRYDKKLIWIRFFSCIRTNLYKRLLRKSTTLLGGFPRGVVILFISLFAYQLYGEINDNNFFESSRKFFIVDHGFELFL